LLKDIDYNYGKMLSKEAGRILKPNEKINISIPNLSNPYMKFLQVTHKNIEHINEFAESISAYFRIIHLNYSVSLPIFIPKISRFIKKYQDVITIV